MSEPMPRDSDETERDQRVLELIDDLENGAAKRARKRITRKGLRKALRILKEDDDAR